MKTDFHGILLGLCIVATVAMFVTMLVSIVMHRRAATCRDRPYWARATLEVVWGLIPCLMVAGAAWPAIQKLERPAAVAHQTSAVSHATPGRIL